MLPLEGKTAVVTGGTRKLGYAIALGLSRAGAAVVVTGRDDRLVHEASDRMAADTGRPVIGHVHDVRDEAGARNLANIVANTFGGCDVLVNNAAGWLTGTLLDAESAAIDETVDSIVKGPIFMVRAFWELLALASPGYIVNITTLGARQSRSNASPVYVAAKFGLAGFTDALRRLAIKSDIRVCEILPGSVASEFSLDDLPERVREKYGLDRIPPVDVVDAVLFSLTRSASAMIEDIGLPAVGDWDQDYARY